MIGPLARSHALDEFFRASAPLLAIDGGCQPFLESTYNTRPFLHIGDGDSTKRQPEIFLDSKKDYSDLAYALALINQSPWRKLHLTGFFGGRFDHQLAVLGELHTAMTATPKAQEILFYDHPLYLAQRGKVHFEYSGPFSLMSLGQTQVCIKGSVDYPLLTPTLLPNFTSRGLSNVAHGAVEVEIDNPILIIFLAAKLPALHLEPTRE